MPFGSGPLIREALVHASSWQRALIGVAMVAGGVGLVLVGHVAGALLSVGGALILWRMIYGRLRLRSKTSASAAEVGPE